MLVRLVPSDVAGEGADLISIEHSDLYGIQSIGIRYLAMHRTWDSGTCSK